jgi:hypothetical protein
METEGHVKNNAYAVEIKIKWMIRRHDSWKKIQKGYIKLSYVVCLSDTDSSCYVAVMGSLIVLVNKRAD